MKRHIGWGAAAGCKDCKYQYTKTTQGIKHRLCNCKDHERQCPLWKRSK